MERPSYENPPLIPPVILRPAWASPLFTAATEQFRVTDVTLPAGKVTLIAEADPTRWGIGIIRPQIVASTVLFGPFADLATFGLSAGNAGTFSFFKLFDYGPMVSIQWYALATNPDTIRVIEVLNQ